MTEAEYGPWRAQAREGFARSLIERGASTDEAYTRRASDVRFLPDGLASANTVISVLESDGDPVGVLWLGLWRPDSAFVLDVEVHAEHRGAVTGDADAARRAQAAEGGKDRIALHVFAGNDPAERLYISLGYETPRTTSTRTSPEAQAPRPGAGPRSPRCAPQAFLALAAVETQSVDHIGGGAGHTDRLALGLVGVDDQDVPAVDQGGVELLGVQAEFVGHLDEERLAPAAQLVDPGQHGLYVRPALSCASASSAACAAAKACWCFSREVPQPQLEPVAVALAQRSQVLEGGAAVGALELAPDVQDGGGGTGGGGIAHGRQSPRTADASQPDLTGGGVGGDCGARGAEGAAPRGGADPEIS